MKHTLLCITLLCTALPALAGRPLSTDDTGTAGDKQCQIEAWRDNGQQLHDWVAAPACGLGDFELSTQISRTTAPSDNKATAASLGLKWAPQQAKLGPVSFAAKVWTGRTRDPQTQGGWYISQDGVLATATWDIGAGLSASTNLGSQRNRQSQESARLANLSLSWAPHERVLIFAEALNTEHAGTTQATGLRVWAVPNKLGIDLTGSRIGGVRDSRSISVGFGWYGIFGD